VDKVQVYNFVMRSDNNLVEPTITAIAKFGCPATLLLRNISSC
jgi:hypothetical protein